MPFLSFNKRPQVVLAGMGVQNAKGMLLFRSHHGTAFLWPPAASSATLAMEAMQSALQFAIKRPHSRSMHLLISAQRCIVVVQTAMNYCMSMHQQPVHALIHRREPARYAKNTET